MWILLLFLGFVVGSPLPEFEDQPVSLVSDGVETGETKTLSQLHTVPFAPPKIGERNPKTADLVKPSQEVEDIQPVSITSPTMFNHKSREGTGQFTQKQMETGNFNNQMQNDPEASEASDNKEVQVTSEVRTVSFQINKKLADGKVNVVHPLVFAQQPPEINLEPTEVEAPGTTPTTVSMVTENVSSITVHNSPITFIERSFSSTANKDSVEKHNGRVVIIESNNRNQAYANYTPVPVSIKSDVVLERKKSAHKIVNQSFKEFPQQDDPRILMIESYPALGELTTTISKALQDNLNRNKEENNHPTASIQHQSSNSTNDGSGSTIQSSEDFVRNVEENEEVKYNITSPTEDDLIVPILDPIDDLETVPPNIATETLPKKDALSSGEDNFKQTKSENVTKNNRPSFDEPLILELKSKLEPEKHNQRNIHSSGTSNATKTPNNDRMAEEAVPANTEGDSPVIETRQTNKDSFFQNFDSPEQRKSRIFIEDNGQTVSKNNQTIANKNEYVSAVYTSSSEIDYRNYNPVSNSSNKTSTSIQVKIRNSTRLLNNSSTENKFHEPIIDDTKRPLEQPHIPHVKIIYNDMIPDTNDEREEDSYATSLPSQTSIVKPLEDNISGSSLRRETFPSSDRITKSPLDARSHRNLPVSLQPISLEIYPENQPLSPSVKKERASITIAQHIEEPMTSGGVAAIVLGVLLTLAAAAGGTSYYLYSRQTGIRPKVLSSDRSCSNSDSGGYLDDQCRVAYVNSQVDITKGSPEDLVSLDNDSFLNSLESMTIQNLWTDSIRHTKL